MCHRSGRFDIQSDSHWSPMIELVAQVIPNCKLRYQERSSECYRGRPGSLLEVAQIFRKLRPAEIVQFRDLNLDSQIR